MREREDPTQVVPRDLAYFLPSKTSQRLAIQVPVVDTNVVCRTAYHCGASALCATLSSKVIAPDCTTSPPFGVNGSRKNGFVVTVSTRALNGGRGASVAACAAVAWGCARSHCSRRAPIGQLQRFCRALPTARLGS